MINQKAPYYFGLYYLTINKFFFYSAELNSAFPDLVHAVKPLLKNPQIYKGWMHGFACAECSFFV